MFAYAVRTQEIGIRMALGAQARDVLRLIAREGFLLALAGIGIGLTGALFAVVSRAPGRRADGVLPARAARFAGGSNDRAVARVIFNGSVKNAVEKDAGFRPTALFVKTS